MWLDLGGHGFSAMGFRDAGGGWEWMGWYEGGGGGEEDGGDQKQKNQNDRSKNQKLS